MRLGGQECALLPGSLARQIYGKETIIERHRHRYEVNNRYIPHLMDAGMRVSGISANEDLCEMIELTDHPWFIGCQFHPEFTSTPRAGHPLFSAFIRARNQAARSRCWRQPCRSGEAPGRNRWLCRAQLMRAGVPAAEHQHDDGAILVLGFAVPFAGSESHETVPLRSGAGPAAVLDRWALRGRVAPARIRHRRQLQAALRRARQSRSSTSPPTTRPTAARASPSADRAWMRACRSWPRCASSSACRC